MEKRGSLFLVGTPIGNLGDLTARAADTLREAALVAAEDTRRTGLLLARIGSRVPMLSLHGHNEARRIPEILRRLSGGEDVAVVSDAGNPGVSDPAERLVRAAIDGGFAVIPVPGPSAFLAALVASGLPVVPFRFEGYPPARRAGRRECLRRLKAERATIVFHESPRRVRALVAEIADLLGDRRVVLAREITKKFEEFFRGTARAAAAHLDEKPPRGEFVVLVAGAGEEESLPRERVLALVREEAAAGHSMRDAVRTVARVARWKEQDLYRLIHRKRE